MVVARLRRWGNSYGVVVPKEEVRKRGLREGDLVDIRLEARDTSYRRLFGTLKTRKTAAQMLRDARLGEDED